MSLVKNLVITVSNEEEGLTLSINTVKSLGDTKLLIKGDPGTYELSELKEAIRSCEAFIGGSNETSSVV